MHVFQNILSLDINNFFQNFVIIYLTEWINTGKNTGIGF